MLIATLTLRILFLGRRKDDEMVSDGLAVVIRQSVGRIPSAWSVGIGEALVLAVVSWRHPPLGSSDSGSAGSFPRL